MSRVDTRSVDAVAGSATDPKQPPAAADKGSDGGILESLGKAVGAPVEGAAEPEEPPADPNEPPRAPG